MELRLLGVARVDALLAGVVERCEAAFPARIRGYYVEGSYASASGVATSDVDIVIIVKDRFAATDERERIAAICAECAAASALELDVTIEDEAAIAGRATPDFKLGAWLIYGEDIRDQLVLPPIDVWTRDRMHTSYWRFINLFGRHTPVDLPLAYPDPGAEFLGYTQRQVRRADGALADSTRDLIRAVGWAATGLIALTAGEYVASKRECHVVYARAVGDEWSTLLRDIYERCRGEWMYLIPEAAADRQRLRAICARTLGFENDFMTVFREYVVRELRQPEEVAVLAVLNVLAEVPLRDTVVSAALDDLARDAASAAVRECARTALRQIRER